jgi:hypothetical protein
VGVVEKAVGSMGTDFSVEIIMPTNKRTPLPIMFVFFMKINRYTIVPKMLDD